MASIVDVAKRAGVSVTTVSRVLNNTNHPVNEQTANRVRVAAEALEYSPSALARALVKDQTLIIGVIVGDISDPYFSTIVRGISEVALARGYLTVICNSDRIPDIELHFVQLLRDYRADGIIFSGGGLQDADYVEKVSEIIGRLNERNVPVVALGHHSIGAPEVNIDNVQAARDMTDYLIQLGHRRIGFVGGPPILTTSGLRLSGYRDALQAAHIPWNSDYVVEGDFTFEGGVRATDALLRAKPKPTAIFASSDMMAIGCMTQLKQKGYDVPVQMSLAGFDDIEAAHFVDPPLTTIHVPMREMGSLGIELVLGALAQSGPIEGVQYLPHAVVVRSSTAPPPTRAR